ncbi:recombination regulator RecX [Burkholderia sp. WAC0059]|uniref:recombination regulator RecX n=1 Tax=Burkholderia sp. WAC0059 TaxID=2066022 RepID=UPI000C7F14DC|nr:recombination regulator RecX [Burkholderia sp. WAC0059]
MPAAKRKSRTKKSKHHVIRKDAVSPDAAAVHDAGGLQGETGDGGRQSSRASSSEPQRPGRSLKARALNYLSRREYSRAELSRKLMPHAESADALESLLDALTREGWLSDARFAESVVHRRAARMGVNRIVSELRRHAVGDALIEAVGSQLRETELTRAQAVWRKKYGQLPTSPAERARQARFLAARGFSMGTIGKILRGLDDEWGDA